MDGIRKLEDTKKDIAFRKKVRTQDDVDVLKKQAQEIFKRYRNVETDTREKYKAPSLYDFVPIVFTPTLPIQQNLHKYSNLNILLFNNCASMIKEINLLFDVFRKEKNAIKICNLLIPDITVLSKKSIVDIGELYADILCSITKGTTWYTRKDSEWLMKKYARN